MRWDQGPPCLGLTLEPAPSTYTPGPASGSLHKVHTLPHHLARAGRGPSKPITEPWGWETGRVKRVDVALNPEL